MLNRIKDNIYKNHIGLVFKLDSATIHRVELPDNSFKFDICDCKYEIVNFYKQVGYLHMDIETISMYLMNGVRFYCIRHSEKIIAINAIFIKEVYYKGLSFYTLLKNNYKKIELDSSTAYSGLAIVSPQYRGNNLLACLYTYILECLSHENISNIIFTTGVTNSSMIKITLHLNAKLICIAEIKRILRYFIIRNELYIDNNEISWRSV